MVYTSMHNISCRSSSHVFYCITCKACGKQYVGQTLRRIKGRSSEHLRDIEQANKEKPLGLHFVSTKHEKNDTEIHILEFIRKAVKPTGFSNQKQGEEKIIFIHLLRTPVPHGLNLEESSSQEQPLHCSQYS